MMTTAPTRENPWDHVSDHSSDHSSDHAHDHASAHVRPAFRSQRPNCPDCGGLVLVADHARFDATGRIDHVWSCDDCGKEFVTSINMVRALVA
jgi:ribosomal protein S27AE